MSPSIYTVQVAGEVWADHPPVDLLRHLKTVGVPNLAARVSHRDFFQTCGRLRVVSPGLEFLQVIESQDIRPTTCSRRTVPWWVILVRRISR